MDIKLYIICGLPGSGKTTFGRHLMQQGVVSYVAQADDFFGIGDKYQFDPTKLKEAHDWCYNNVVNLLKDNYRVAVCNTFSRRWERQRYLDLPYPKVVIKMLGEYPNIHGVPPETIQRMKERWED